MQGSYGIKPTACLALSDGTVFFGEGFGLTGQTTAELCFNTSMTGYQEILTDPSYAGQIVTFTFPHIGNVGVNFEDNEASKPFACGMVVKWRPTLASSWRAKQNLIQWLESNKLIAIGGVDTRRLTRTIRKQGAPHVALEHNPNGKFNTDALIEEAKRFEGLSGLDLAKNVTAGTKYNWTQDRWKWAKGYRKIGGNKARVVAIDFGVKENILRCLAAVRCEVIVLPATATAEEVLAYNPDGVFLSNGPGDPEATGKYSVNMIRTLLKVPDLPIFGICLGHQMLALSLGAKTIKMNHGHHGANHPVKDISTGKVEITAMNHGFAVDTQSLPNDVEETHVSLFDGSNCGIKLVGRPVYSVQHHPEASPGPMDSFYLFERFAADIESKKSLNG